MILSVYGGEGMASAHHAMSRLRGVVLILDEDQPTREYVGDLMVQLSYQTWLVSRPEDALKTLRQSHYEVLLSGFALGLKPKSGLEFLHTVVEEIERPPHIIMMSAYAFPERKIGKQIAPLILKPPTLADLKRALPQKR